MDGRGPRFCLYVHHTDARREWAYDRQSPVGKLDRLDEARANGWTVVSMKGRREANLSVREVSTGAGAAAVAGDGGGSVIRTSPVVRSVRGA